MNFQCFFLKQLLNFFYDISCASSKARRKERDDDSGNNDTKLYLEENVLEKNLPDADLRQLVDLPAGLDYNEWLASHSKYFKFDNLSKIFDHYNFSTSSRAN
jgi:Mob1/phocein family